MNELDKEQTRREPSVDHPSGWRDPVKHLEAQLAECEKRAKQAERKAKKYDEIMEVVQNDSLASDGLEMIQSAMRDAE